MTKQNKLILKAMKDFTTWMSDDGTLSGYDTMKTLLKKGEVAPSNPSEYLSAGVQRNFKLRKAITFPISRDKTLIVYMSLKIGAFEQYLGKGKTSWDRGDE